MDTPVLFALAAFLTVTVIYQPGIEGLTTTPATNSCICTPSTSIYITTANPSSGTTRSYANLTSSAETTAASTSANFTTTSSSLKSASPESGSPTSAASVVTPSTASGSTATHTFSSTTIPGRTSSTTLLSSSGSGINSTTTPFGIGGNFTTTSAGMGSSSTTASSLGTPRGISTTTSPLGGGGSSTTTSSFGDGSNSTSTARIGNYSTASSAGSGSNSTTTSPVGSGSSSTTTSPVGSGSNSTTTSPVGSGSNSTTTSPVGSGSNSTITSIGSGGNSTTTSSVISGGNSSKTATTAMGAGNATTTTPHAGFGSNSTSTVGSRTESSITLASSGASTALGIGNGTTTAASTISTTSPGLLTSATSRTTTNSNSTSTANTTTPVLSSVTASTFVVSSATVSSAAGVNAASNATVYSGVVSSTTGPTTSVGIVSSTTGPTASKGIVSSTTGPTASGGIVSSTTGPTTSAGITSSTAGATTSAGVVSSTTQTTIATTSLTTPSQPSSTTAAMLVTSTQNGITSTASSAQTSTTFTTPGIERSTTTPAVTHITDDLLSRVFATNAYSLSTASYTFEPTTSVFTVPVVSGSQIVIDTIVGETGAVCRDYPKITLLCVSPTCAGCNLVELTADVRTNIDDNGFYKIFYPNTAVGSKICVNEAIINRYEGVRVRYIVINPTRRTGSSSVYRFSVTMSGSFPAYKCPAGRRRREVATAGASSCVCPIGSDPLLPSSKTVSIVWRLPKLPFREELANFSTSAQRALASEAYYQLTKTVRASAELSSLIGDFRSIWFANRTADGLTGLTGELLVVAGANDTQIQTLLRALMPGYGDTIDLLFVGQYLDGGSTKPNIATTSMPKPDIGTGFPVYGIVLVCVLPVVVLAALTVLILTLKRRNALSALKLPVKFYHKNDNSNRTGLNSEDEYPSIQDATAFTEVPPADARSPLYAGNPEAGPSPLQAADNSPQQNPSPNGKQTKRPWFFEDQEIMNQHERIDPLKIRDLEKAAILEQKKQINLNKSPGNAS